MGSLAKLSNILEMARGGSRRKEISKKSTLNYKEVYDELVNQNEIPIKMTATKEDLNILEANFNRKIDKMSNIHFKNSFYGKLTNNTELDYNGFEEIAESIIFSGSIQKKNGPGKSKGIYE